MPLQTTEPRVIVALDFADLGPARELVRRVDPSLCRLKVGKEMYTRYGPHFVAELTRAGFDVFLDLKFHDIPSTVAAACAAAADLGVWMVNVHASGGRKMMEAARERIARSSHRPLLIAVTVLTSLGQSDIEEVGFAGTPEANVVRLATLTKAAGLDGVVCSPREAAAIRAAVGPGFLLVTPGVRPASAALDDQQRVMTPVDAIAAGADYLVIGRPVTQSPDPVGVLRDLAAQIAGS
jgi:orotidine-5'-phosphate decarboxylase